MKSLRAIQIIAQVMRILCLVCFILSIVGAVGCVIGMAIFGAVSNVIIEEGKTLAQYLLDKGISVQTVYAGMGVGLGYCLVAIFLFKYRELFYVRELAVGTPFDSGVIADMRKVAVVDIIVNVVSNVVIVVVFSIVHSVIPEVKQIDGWGFSSITYGLILLLISLFCAYPVEKAASDAFDKEVKEIKPEDYAE